jgi:hypothetical protein
MTYIGRMPVLVILAALFVGAGADLAMAQESATVTLPTSVSFTVSDVGAASAGSPATTRAAFTDANLLPDRRVRISVRADTDTFSNGANTFAASLVSWAIAGTTNGTGLSGAISATSWTPVFEGYVNSTEGAADLRWTLDAPGRTRAGTHTLAVRWLIESVTP